MLSVAPKITCADARSATPAVSRNWKLKACEAPAPAGGVTDSGCTLWVLLVIARFCGAESSEPGFKIATCAVPGVVSRFAGTVACTCAELTKLAGSANVVPLGAVHQTDAPDWKLLPLAVMVTAAEFFSTVLGLIEVNWGCCEALTPVIRNACCPVSPKPGFWIATCAVPGVVS